MGFRSPLWDGMSSSAPSSALTSALTCVIINLAMQLKVAPSERCMSLQRGFTAHSAQGLVGQTEMNHGHFDGVSWFLRAWGAHGDE